MPGPRSGSGCAAGSTARTRRARRRTWLAAASALGLALLGAAAPARAEWPDWQAIAGVPVIKILTTDADGDARETRVWFVLIEGQPYLRTRDSRWLANLRRDPRCRLRIEGREYAAHATEVTGEAMVEAVDAASREKYGWQERLIHVFRTRTPEILRLTPRATGE